MEINKDIKISETIIDGHSYIPDSTFKKLPMNSLHWATSTTGWNNQLYEFKVWLKSDNAPSGAYLMNLSFNGGNLSAFVQKANNSYISAMIISYYSNPKFIFCSDGNWKEDINIPTLMVEQAYLGHNPNINEQRYKAGIYGLYQCSQAPTGSIGVLEVIYYSQDWVCQRFTDIEGHHMWERYFTSGTTWSGWAQRW